MYKNNRIHNHKRQDMNTHIITAISVFAFLLPASAQASVSWESEGYTLKLSGDRQNCVEITGYSGDETELRIPAVFRKDGVSYTVSSIGRQAFYYNRNLTEVILPEGLSHIGEMAFTGCGNLRTIVMPESLASIDPFAFTETGVKAMVIPDSVGSLDFAAVLNCGELGTLVIGKGVRSIGECALGQLKGLKELYVLSSEIPAIEEDTTPFCDAACSGATVYVPSGLLSGYPRRPDDKRHIKESMFHDYEDGWWYFHDYRPIPDLFTVLYKDSYSVGSGESAQVLYETVNYKGVTVYGAEWISDDESVATVSDGYVTGHKAGATKGRVKVRTSQGVFSSRDFDITVTGSEGNPSPMRTRGREDSSNHLALVPDESGQSGIYTLDGVYLGTDVKELTPGIYIERTGRESRKITVK